MDGHFGVSRTFPKSRATSRLAFRGKDPRAPRLSVGCRARRVGDPRASPGGAVAGEDLTRALF